MLYKGSKCLPIDEELITKTCFILPLDPPEHGSSTPRGAFWDPPNMRTMQGLIFPIADLEFTTKGDSTYQLSAL